MKKRNPIHLIWVALLTTTLYKASAQQEVTFSQYMFANQLLNPAYVGTKKYVNATALNRIQWVGFEGAPNTQALALNGRVKRKNLGWGVSIVNDQIGPVVNTMLDIDASYHLRLNSKNHQLALGVKFGTYNYGINSALIQTLLPSDNAFIDNMNIKLQPNIGFGIYYHQERFYAGFSIPRLLDNEFYNVSPHGYLLAGGYFSIADQWDVKPSMLIKQSRGSSMGYDLSVLFVFEDNFWLGPQYRSSVETIIPNTKMGGSYGLLGGVHINSNWSIGYSYNTGLGNLISSFNSGTHELILRFDFNMKSVLELRSPRIF
ncbi:MAG: type IX secretion system membrane protein PorP/SprF [Flavobacteriaceae bacterium]